LLVTPLQHGIKSEQLGHLIPATRKDRDKFYSSDKGPFRYNSKKTVPIRGEIVRLQMEKLMPCPSKRSNFEVHKHDYLMPMLVYLLTGLEL
jgi:hypothetical protein